MKSIHFLVSILITTIAFTSCSSDDDNPDPIHEEEVITTLIATLSPEGSGEVITMTYTDLDGDGPEEPSISVSGALEGNTTYTGSLSLLNETEEPAEDINEEILEEAEEHQFFYNWPAALDVTEVTYLDQDSDGNPVGLEFLLETGSASEGAFSIILRHEPDKFAEGVSSGTIDNAGGETDISVSFPVEID